MKCLERLILVKLLAAELTVVQFQAALLTSFGEEGQEVFIPGMSGMIVPNDVFEATKAALIR